MTTGLLDAEEHRSGRVWQDRPLRWWKEVLFVTAVYAAYSVVRDIGGSRPVSRVQAFHNARRVISLERLFGIFQEQRIQHLFLGDRALLSFLDVFYGTAHFVVTLVVLIWLFRQGAGRYRLWRTTIAFTTALALIGFAFFPLMPPRLLPAGYHFVDTLRTVGGLWSFDSGAVSKLSNQYAAMPSLHFAWSSWSALVLAPALKRRSTKLVVYAYPFLTLFCIVVTANHYFLDAVGGAVALAVGFLLAKAVSLAADARGRTPTEESPVALGTGESPPLGRGPGQLATAGMG